jgi:hypothetical protein
MQVMQALRELQKFEVALNGANLKDPQGRSVTNHKASARRWFAAPAAGVLGMLCVPCMLAACCGRASSADYRVV